MPSQSRTESSPQRTGGAHARSSRVAQPPLTLRKKTLFSLLVMLLFFVLAEVTLWAVGVSTLIARTDPSAGFSGLLKVFEPDGDVLRTRAVAVGKTFNAQTFLADKPPNGLRLFSVGGSSAYGFPWGANSAFSTVLGEALAKSHPELQVESINAGGISYGLHRASIVAEEALEYEPDILIIYSGHNEFIEPTFFEAEKRRGSGRASAEHLLAHSRVYSLAHSAIARLDNRSRRTAIDATKVSLSSPKDFSEQEKQKVVFEFRERLESLIQLAQAAGSRVVVTTVPCNLRDWIPNASTAASMSDHTRRLWSQAIRAGREALAENAYDLAVDHFHNALQLSPNHAEALYLLGQAYEGQHRWSDAREYYRQACDADASPNRRLSAINDAILEIGRLNGALVVDLDHVFQENSDQGLVGFNLIEDFVHPTREGHQLIAWHLLDAIERSGWLGQESPADRDIFDQIVASHAQRSPPVNADWFFNQGVVLQNQGHAEAAISKYREAIAADRQHISSTANLGVLLMNVGRTREAVAVLERALQLDPNLDWVHNSLGLAYLRLGQANKAKLALEQALSLSPELGEAHCNLGMLCADQGRYTEAVDHYQTALDIDAGNIEAISNLGSALHRLKRYQEAAEVCRRAIRIRPDYAPAHHNLANALQGMGELEEAVLHYDEALAANPRVGLTYLNRGLVLQSLDRRQEAAESFLQATRLNANDLESRRRLAESLFSLGQFREAAQNYRAVLQSQPNDPSAHNNLGNALQAMGNLEAALTSYQASLTLRPDNPGTLGNLALTLQRLGRHDDALKHFESVLRIAPNNPEVHLQTAKTYLALGQLDLASRHLDRAIRLRPDHAESRLVRSELFLRTDSLDKALEDLDTAIARHPRRADFYLKRSRLHTRLGNTSQSLDDLNQAVTLTPELADSYLVRASFYVQQNEYQVALADYQRAAELAPNHIGALNDLAWFQATCPAAAYRDGKAAVANAWKACQLTPSKQFSLFDTLAAAHAENGDYSEAVRWQRQAIDLSSERARPLLQSRLELYENNTPYRHEPDEQLRQTDRSHDASESPAL